MQARRLFEERKIPVETKIKPAIVIVVRKSGQAIDQITPTTSMGYSLRISIILLHCIQKGHRYEFINKQFVSKISNSRVAKVLIYNNEHKPLAAFLLEILKLNL